MRSRHILELSRILLLMAGWPVCLHAQKAQNVALTPPMGWNSWNGFGRNVDESLIRRTAAAMESTGMREAGYQYIIVDDYWQGERDSMGFIHPNGQRFPSGMKALAADVHSKGLKFGLYSCAGDRTCGGLPGSRGHEYQDAVIYAAWGIDYLKYDWCNTTGLDPVGAYTTMRDALFAAGRPVVFSICEWGNSQPWLWAREVGHLWRTTGDITNCFDCEINHGSWSSWGVMQTITMRKEIRKYAGPGHWNDPDMLEVGNGMPVNEDRAHFSLWCMLAAPLIAGNDLTTMTRETIDILTNREAIAVDQDSLGVQGLRYNDNQNGTEVWIKPLSRGDWAICFLNRSGKSATLLFNWAHQWIADDISGTRMDPNGVYAIRDLWKQRPLGTTATPLKAEVPSHDVLMLRLTPDLHQGP